VSALAFFGAACSNSSSAGDAGDSGTGVSDGGADAGDANNDSDATPAGISITRTFAHHEITKVTAPEIPGRVVLSGNGQGVVFQRRDEAKKATGIYFIKPDGTGQVEVDSYIDAEGSTVDGVDISTDAQQILSGNSGVLRYAGASGAPKRTLVQLSQNRIQDFRFSPDGKQVFFVAGPDDFTIKGETKSRQRGVWALKPDGTDLHQVVGPEGVATALGVNVSDIVPYHGCASRKVGLNSDGSRLSFLTVRAVTDPYFGQLFSGPSPLTKLVESERKYPYAVYWTDMSTDGSKVVYAAGLIKDGSAITEVGVIGFDGTGRKALTTSTSPLASVGSCTPLWLSSDGSKLYSSGGGHLFNTDGSGVLQLALGLLPGSSGGYGDGTMNQTATRFAYRLRDEGIVAQIMVLDIDPSDLGNAPQISAPYTSLTNLVAGGPAATVSVNVAAKGTVTRVIGAVFVDGIEDKSINSEPQLFDDGTNGDAKAGDGVYTSNRVGAWAASKPGPRTLRIRVETKVGDRRHFTEVDVAGFSVP
jgi:hypothetical protein